MGKGLTAKIHQSWATSEVFGLGIYEIITHYELIFIIQIGIYSQKSLNV